MIQWKIDVTIYTPFQNDCVQQLSENNFQRKIAEIIPAVIKILVAIFQLNQ